MKTASLAARYILPAAVAGGLVAFCLSLSFRTPAEPNDGLELVEFPHGQCLVAVVEWDGVYLGTQRVPVDEFGTVFDRTYRHRHLDWAVVLGTKDSRFGDAVKVYSKLYGTFGHRITLGTHPVTSGKRWNAVTTLNWFCAPQPVID